MARKTAGSGNSWDRKGELHGHFVKMLTEQGVHKSNAYHVEQDNGDIITVWGSTVLDTKFQEIPVGSEVWITCLGETTGKRGSKYVDYQVDYDDELPLAEAAEAGGTPLNGTEDQEAKNTFN